MVTEKRDVCSFSRVRMQDWGELHIAQGKEEVLTVETDGEILAQVVTQVRDGELILRVGRQLWERLEMGLHTSLTRPRIRYSLVVRNLNGLAVFGYGHAVVGVLNTSGLAVELSGAGQANLQSLSADSLQVTLSGGGSIVVAGKAQRQSVALSGVGQYDAGQLQSQDAHVVISGAGNAKVWVTDELEVRLSGIGSVEYYGDPAMHRSGWGGLGTIRRLGSRQPGLSAS